MVPRSKTGQVEITGTGIRIERVARPRERRPHGADIFDADVLRVSIALIDDGIRGLWYRRGGCRNRGPDRPELRGGLLRFNLRESGTRQEAERYEPGNEKPRCGRGFRMMPDDSLVERRRIELPTFALRTRRSPS